MRLLSSPSPQQSLTIRRTGVSKSKHHVRCRKSTRGGEGALPRKSCTVPRGHNSTPKQLTLFLPPPSRVGQLEEKIDGIMSLLNASQQISTPPPPQHVPSVSRNSIHQLLNPNVESTATIPEGPARGPPISSPSPPHATHSHSNARLMPTAGLVGSDPPSLAAHHHHHHQASSSAVQDSVEIWPGFRVTFLEADRALNLYRSIYSPHFPFVTVPAMTSPHDLYEKAPLLFRTVVAVTTPPQGPVRRVHAEFNRWFREHVAQHVVVQNEARLEVLQSVLVYLAWGGMINSEATSLIQLATGLVIDLGLDRRPSDFGSGAAWRKEHSLDEMRAALGAFYVTSLYVHLWFSEPFFLSFFFFLFVY